MDFLHPIPLLRADGLIPGSVARTAPIEGFLAQLPQPARDIVAAADSLGLALTPAQRDALLAMGCTYAQGWLFYPSIPSERLIELVMVDRRASRAMVAD